MDEELWDVGQGVQVVDPDVRAHVYSLVTALGGFNGEDADRYVLGDDALACLRDIKRWLKLYDEKNNRMDVARCLGEANLVNGDLLPILSLWWANGQKNKHMVRIALACLELLVPLTWPVEIHNEMTVNHHRHVPYIQQAQVQYKRGILSHGGSSLLRTIIRVGLPSMAVPRSERTTRDEGILKLMLYLFRNIAIITPNTRLAAEGDEEETSRSATVISYSEQDVFALLLTMCSNMGDDFNQQDMVLLETIFHLIKGVNVEKLFMDDEQRKAKRTDELSGLLQKECSLRREYAKNAPTRHGRFGTMIWVKRDDAKVSTVSGQNVLKDGQAAMLKMDQSKKWNRPQPRRRPAEVNLNNDFNTPAHLSSAATKALRSFVEEFLDSGFNPLFTHVRKAIEREADRVTDINTRQYFYTVAWFLQAERMRRAQQKRKHEASKGTSKEIEPDSFSLIASVLTQETFVFLNRAMQYAFDNKAWEDLNAGMRCFTQILLTVQEMAQSPLEEDQEIADNIQNRIFYEETTHDRILAILRGFKDQGFGYLDACTELAHVFLRMLEQYSKENVDMQVRSKRRARRKKNAEEKGRPEPEERDEEADSEEEELAEAARVSKERKFDFKRFSVKFSTQKCVDTFVAFTKFYKELNEEQLKRAHRFFYRVAFKLEMSVLLFRLDIINLFYTMIKGPGALESSRPIFQEWKELVGQILRKLFKKLEQRPALVTELLFSKINATVYYLEYGHEKPTISVERKAPAELEVHPKYASNKAEKINIVVSALVKDEHTDLVQWLTQMLTSAADEREAWEAQHEARRAEDRDLPETPSPMISVVPRDELCEKAMFLNNKLRLLLTLLGFERLGVEDVPGASWIVPSSMTAKGLRDLKAAVEKSLEAPVTELDGRDITQCLRRKNRNDDRDYGDEPLATVDFGSDSEGEDVVPDGILFPPNPRSKSNVLDELKKKRQKKRNVDHERELLDDETLAERQRARLANSLAKQAKIKSDLYIHASDDETDEEADQEFFRKEEERRKAQASRVKEALLTGKLDGEILGSNKTRNGRKRDSTAHRENGAESGKKRQRRGRQSSGSAEEGDENDVEGDDVVMTGMEVDSPSTPREVSESQDHDGRGNTPPTSAEDDLDFDDDLIFSRNRRNKSSFTEPTQPDVGDENAGNDDDDDDAAPVAASSRRRVRGGFVLDSDSE